MGVAEGGLISTGIRPLDELLGGWERGRITLIVGKTGVGKTTILLSSAISLSRIGAVIFIDCEGNLSGALRRLIQPLNNLHASSPSTAEEQAKIVRGLRLLSPSFLSSVVAVIVDGIAYHYHPWIRCAETDRERDEAQSWLEGQFYELSTLARRLNVPVVASTWPTSELDREPGEEGLGIVGGFAASAYSRTILEVRPLTELSRSIRVLKHQNPSLTGKEIELRASDLPIFQGAVVDGRL